MVVIQLLTAFFSVFVLSRVFLRFREGKISATMFALWVLVWFSAIVFVLSPDSFTWVSKSVGIQRPLDMALVSGFLLSYYLIFRLYILLEDLRSDLAKVVRQLSLSEKGGKK